MIYCDFCELYINGGYEDNCVTTTDQFLLFYSKIK